MAQNSKLLWQKSGDIYKISKGVDRVLRRYLVLSGVSILSQTAKGAKAGWTTQASVLKGLQPTLSAKMMLKWFKTILSATFGTCLRCSSEDVEYGKMTHTHTHTHTRARANAPERGSVLTFCQAVNWFEPNKKCT